MPRYSFEIVDGDRRDVVGDECATPAQVREAARAALPTIAQEAIPEDGERRTFSVVARDAQGRAVYAATLSYVGLWLAAD